MTAQAPSQSKPGENREIKGWHVLSIFIAAFSVIIAVNLTLAFNAVATFPGLEVKNSYVASQAFDRERTAQLALGWDVSATLNGHDLVLNVIADGTPIAPIIEAATFGRATTVGQDQTPAFVFQDGALRATVDGGAGNWNLRLKMRADDGTLFQQRVIVSVGS
jgi:nitrogen fixation protein FixH